MWLLLFDVCWLRLFVLVACCLPFVVCGSLFVVRCGLGVVGWLFDLSCFIFYCRLPSCLLFLTC